MIKVENILFSVIMPVYNAETYLEKSVDSILNQTLSDFELVLIDDGSTDTSPQLCDRFREQDSRVIVIHQKNGGQTVARRAGSEIATGKYILCVDSDDWIRSDTLERIKEVLAAGDIDVVCYGMILVKGNEETPIEIGFRKGLYNKTEIEEEIYPYLIHPASGEGFPVSLWGKAIKTEIYKFYQASVDLSLKMGEDLACSLPCIYNSNSIYIVDDCLYYYRQNPLSYTKNKPVLSWEGPEKIAVALEKSIDITKYDFQEQLYRRIVRELFLVSASQFNRNESYKTIKDDINSHLKCNIYDESIKKVHFNFKLNKTNLRYNFFKLTLKFRLFSLIKLYNGYYNR